MTSTPAPDVGAARVSASGVGSLPGEDYVEAVRLVLGELPDLPHVPELPARGVTAQMTGRTLGMVAELGFDLQPAGWRLTDAPGVDHRRARSLLAQDLDTVEEQTQGLGGRLKLQVTGPWTLAATVEKPRGDRVLADVGARRDLGQALVEGVVEHVRDVQRRVPGATLVVQVDEPALPAVLAGRVPTASGFGRHRTVHAPEASAALEALFDGIADAGVESVAHCCAADVPIGLLRSAGAGGIGIDVGLLGAAAYDELGALLDGGGAAWLGVVPTEPAEGVPAERLARTGTERVLRLLDMIGYDPGEIADRLVITPTCGLAAATPAYARTALDAVRRIARELA